MFKWRHVTSKIWSITIGSISRKCHNNNRNFYMASVFGFYLTSLVLMTIIYLKILHVAMGHAKAIALSEACFPLADVGGSEARNDNRAGHRATQRKRKKEIKSAKTLAMVYGAFVICWLPSSIISIILFFDTDELFRTFQRKHPSAFMFTYYAFIEVLPVLNTSVNPFIYSFFNGQFRDAFKRVYSKIIQNHFEVPTTRPNSVLSVGLNRSSNRLTMCIWQKENKSKGPSPICG